MTIWWLAIDRNEDFCSYEQLKRRRVVAQGWPEFGDLSKKIQFHYNLKRYEFDDMIKKIGDDTYGDKKQWVKNRESHRAPRIFWNLFNLKLGDLVVAIEGTIVRGICRLNQNGFDGYMYDPTYDYAHAFGGKVTWEDWIETNFGVPPITPSKGIHGISKLRNQANEIKIVWSNFMASK